jgi:hypothetical protein
MFHCRKRDQHVQKHGNEWGGMQIDLTVKAVPRETVVFSSHEHIFPMHQPLRHVSLS